MSPSSRPSGADWEQMAKEVLGDLFWNATTGPEIAPGSGERESWDDLLLRGRLRTAMIQLNLDVPRQYVDQDGQEQTATLRLVGSLPHENEAVAPRLATA